MVPEGPTRGGGAGRARRVVKRDLECPATLHSGAGALTLTYFAWLARQSSSPRFWDPRLGLGSNLSLAPRIHDDHRLRPRCDHNLAAGRASPAPGWVLSSEESGRNKPSIPWMGARGDGGVFAAASFGPPTPTFWLEAGPEVFACTEGEGRVFNVGLNPPCTPRAGGSLLAALHPPAVILVRAPPSTLPAE